MSHKKQPKTVKIFGNVYNKTNGAPAPVPVVKVAQETAEAPQVAL
jgi:hypothetical protein